jgi:hypothetical protein
MTTTPFGPFMTRKPPVDEPAVSELFGRLAADTGLLMRHELSLASLEVTGKAKARLRPVGWMGIGVLVALVGAQTLALAAVLLLDAVLPLWLAASSVGGLLCALSLIAIARGRRALTRIELAPRRTVETLRETETWSRQLVR